MANKNDVLKWWNSFVDEMALKGYDLNNPADKAMVRILKPINNIYDKEVTLGQGAFFNNWEFEHINDSEFGPHTPEWYIKNQIEPDFERINALYEAAKVGNLYVLNNRKPVENADSFRLVFVNDEGNAIVTKTPSELPVDSKTEDEIYEATYNQEYNGMKSEDVTDKYQVLSSMMDAISTSDLGIDWDTFTDEGKEEYRKAYGITEEKDLNSNMFFVVETVKMNFFIDCHENPDEKMRNLIKENQTYKVLSRGGINPLLHSAPKAVIKEDDKNNEQKDEEFSEENDSFNERFTVINDELIISEDELLDAFVGVANNINELEIALATEMYGSYNSNLFKGKEKKDVIPLYDENKNEFSATEDVNKTKEALKNGGLYYWVGNEDTPHRIFYNSSLKSIVTTTKPLERPVEVPKPSGILRLIDWFTGLFGKRIESVEKYEEYTKKNDFFNKFSKNPAKADNNKVNEDEKNLKQAEDIKFEEAVAEKEKDSIQNNNNSNLLNVINAGQASENAIKAAIDSGNISEIRADDDVNIANIVLNNMLIQESIKNNKNPEAETTMNDYVIKFGKDRLIEAINESDTIKKFKIELGDDNPNFGLENPKSKAAELLEDFLKKHGKDQADGILMQKNKINKFISEESKSRKAEKETNTKDISVK